MGKRIQSEEKTNFLSERLAEFQFPSNGKAYPKEEAENRLAKLYAFQFPSNGKAYPKVLYLDELHQWNRKFQFPSNGKAYPKKKKERTMTKKKQKYVSIPFKRESVSKVMDS